MATEKPIGIALIICDRVITDAQTNEKTLVGIFNNVWAPSFPAMHARLSIFVGVTSGRGTVKGAIQCVNESTGQRVFESSGPISFKDPCHIVEITFLLRNVLFVQPGMHNVSFFCDGELVFSRRFNVSQLPNKTEQL